MIENFHDDEKMARYGRSCAKYRAINKAKETIRDNAVFIGNSTDVEEIKLYKSVFDVAILDLIEALEIKVD